MPNQNDPVTTAVNGAYAITNVYGRSATLTLKAKNASTWDFAGKVDRNIGAASTWTTAGTFYFYNGVAGTRTVIESMNDQIFLFPENAGVTSLWLGGPAGFQWSNIYFNGVAGVDQTAFTIEDVNGKKITLAFTKGGCTTCTVA